MNETKREAKKASKRVTLIDKEESKLPLITSNNNQYKIINYSCNVQIVSINVHPSDPIVLTPKAKRILSQKTRTTDEINYIKTCIANLKSFQKFSPLMQYNLANKLHYQSFREGTIIIQQGEASNNVYFITTGAVVIVTKDNGMINILGSYGISESFGESNILNSACSQASAICTENTECLVIDMITFKNILQVTNEMEWKIALDLLLKHPMFQRWNHTDIIKVTEESYFIEFQSRFVIIKDLSTLSDYVYLLVDGLCRVVQKLKMKEQIDYRLRKRHLTLSPQSAHGVRGRTVRRWVTVRTIKPGEIFGIGEGTSYTSIITEQAVKCLAINRRALSKNDKVRSVIWLQHYLTSLNPSKDAIFDKYIVQCQWTEYKKQVLEDVIKKDSLPAITRFKTIGKLL
jgi:CRP-like cAMP-binding protein